MMKICREVLKAKIEMAKKNKESAWEAYCRGADVDEIAMRCVGYWEGKIAALEELLKEDTNE